MRHCAVVVENTAKRENDAQRERLEALISNGIHYGQRLDNGWTIAVALAHMAFWDRRAAALLRRWDVEGSLPDLVDEDLLNATLLPEWQALDPRQAAELAITAAELVDAAVEALDAAKADAIVMIGNQHLIERGKHRGERLDQIESALAA